MGLMTGIFGDLLKQQRQQLAHERRSSLENPQTPLSYPAEWLLDIFNGGRTDSGIRVSELTALQASYFLSGIDLIGGLVAGLPVHVYERKIVANGRAAHSIAYDHDAYDLIAIEPNPEMSRFVFWKAFMAHVLAWGNAYAEIQRDSGNGIVAIWPRNPAKTRPHRTAIPMRLQPEPWRPFPVDIPAGALVFHTTDGIEVQDGSENDAEPPRGGRFIPADDMIHLPGLALDGRIGQSAVWLSRQTIGLALATEKFGAKYFANFARPSGILSAPASTPEQRENAKRSWMEAQGGENAHRVAVMPPGYEWKPMSNNPQEAQSVETEAMLRNKIASLLHLSPRFLGDVERTSKGSSEQDNQELLQVTLNPWLTGIKVELKRKLFPSSGIGRTPKSRFYVDYDLTDFVRPDAASREKYYATGRQWGFLNANDVRAFEKLNPVEEPWAEDYWMPINMTLAETPLDPNHQDGAGVGDKPGKQDEPDASDQPERQFRPFSQLFRDGLRRLLAREKRDEKAVEATIGPVLRGIRDAWHIAVHAPAGCGAETDRFIAEYCGAIAKRAGDWKPEVADAELSDVRLAEFSRAVRGLKVAVYREVAAMKAKEGEQE